MLGGGGGSRALKRASRIAAADPGTDTAEFMGGVDSMCCPPRACTLSMRPVSGKMAGAVNSKLLSFWMQARVRFAAEVRRVLANFGSGHQPHG